MKKSTNRAIQGAGLPMLPGLIPSAVEFKSMSGGGGKGPGETAKPGTRK